MPGASEFHPLDRLALSGDEYELARALRVQFENVKELTLRAYAERSHRDPSNVSRALGGKEVPSWDLIEDLALHAAQDRGELAPSPDTIEDLREKYNRVLAGPARKPGHVLQLVKQQLAEARLEISDRSKREDDLLQRLNAAQIWRANLDSQVLALESGQVRALAIGGAQLALARDGDQLRAERDAAERKIAELRIELEQERKLREEAEGRYEDLKTLLDASRTAEEVGPTDEPVDRARADAWWQDDGPSYPSGGAHRRPGPAWLSGPQREQSAVVESGYDPSSLEQDDPQADGERLEVQREGVEWALAQAELRALQLRVELLDLKIRETAEDLQAAQGALRVAQLDLEREARLRISAEEEVRRLEHDLDDARTAHRGPLQAARDTWEKLGSLLLDEDDGDQTQPVSA